MSYKNKQLSKLIIFLLTKLFQQSGVIFGVVTPKSMQANKNFFFLNLLFAQIQIDFPSRPLSTK